jgi:hypothetical protein
MHLLQIKQSLIFILCQTILTQYDIIKLYNLYLDLQAIFDPGGTWKPTTELTRGVLCRGLLASNHLDPMYVIFCILIVFCEK